MKWLIQLQSTQILILNQPTNKQKTNKQTDRQSNKQTRIYDAELQNTIISVIQNIYWLAFLFNLWNIFNSVLFCWSVDKCWSKWDLISCHIIYIFYYQVSTTFLEQCWLYVHQHRTLLFPPRKRTKGEINVSFRETSVWKGNCSV